MENELYDRASQFFNEMESSPTLRRQIKEYDNVVQFDPKDGEPFHVKISKGKVEFGKGKKYLPDLEEGLYITSDQDTLNCLFKGEMSLADGIYHHKIQIPGYREKEPLMAWFSTLLRKGIEAYGKDHL